MSQVLLDMGCWLLYTSHSHTLLPSSSLGPNSTVITCTNVSAAPAASICNADGDEMLATIYQTTSTPYTSKVYSSKIFIQDKTPRTYRKVLLTLLVRSISAVMRIDGNRVIFHNKWYVCTTPKLRSVEEYSFLNIIIKVVNKRNTMPQKYRKPADKETTQT